MIFLASVIGVTLFLILLSRIMGCTSSKPELDDESIYATAMQGGVDGLSWSENIMVFSESESKGETSKLAGKPSSLKNYRNVVSWLPKDAEAAAAAAAAGGSGSVSVSVEGIVIIAHGVLSHAQSHHREACAYAKAGYAVYAMDHEGHGLSSGVHGRVDDWETLVEDCTCLLCIFSLFLHACMHACVPYSLGLCASASLSSHLTLLFSLISNHDHNNDNGRCLLCGHHESATPRWHPRHSARAFLWLPGHPAGRQERRRP